MTDRRLAFASVALLALAASATSLANGFAYDDFHIIADNARVHDAGNALRLFGQTYWPPERGAALYRPLTMLAFLAQWLVGDGNPLVFHVVNVLAYVGVCLAVLALARRLLPAVPAWVGAAVFAVHPVHVEVVGNVVGQSELWVALAFAVATGAYLRVRVRQLAGEPARGGVLAIVGILALACLAKEHGIVLPALLLAAELTIVAASSRTVAWRERARQVAPLYAGMALVAVVFLVVRSRIVAGLIGDTPHIAFGGQPVGTRLWTMLGVTTEWYRLLVWPAHLAAIYSPPGTPTYDGFDPLLVAPMLTLLALLALVVWAWRRRPVLAFGFVWMAIAILPTSNIFFPSGILLAERTLFVPSIGFALIVGELAVWLLARLRAERPRALRLAGLAFGALLAAGVARSADRHRVWKDNDALFASAVADEPLSYRAHYGQGGMLFTSGRKEKGEWHFRVAMRLMPRDSDVRMDLAREYTKVGMCGPAIPVYQEAIRISPRRPDARASLVACLLAEARFAEAREEAQRGLALGQQRKAFTRLIEIADSVVAARAR